MLKREQIVAMTRETLRLTKTKAAGAPPDLEHFRREFERRKPVDQRQDQAREKASARARA